MFVSIMFPVFLGITVTVFFVLPVKWRPAVLLSASGLFCAWADVRALAVLALVCACTWRAGLIIEGRKKKAYGERKTEEEEGKSKKTERPGRVCLGVTVCLELLALCGYKYVPYLCGRLGWTQLLPKGIAESLAMPVGLSFYVFQSIGYLVEIYRDKGSVEKSFFRVACYLAYFPKLVSGPIERAQDFLPQLERLTQVRFGDRGRLSTAFTYMLWGYFMKMVVADRLAVTVNQIFQSSSIFDSFWLFMGMIFYTIQIYCDFAGYSYIAIGCSWIFGIRLTQNFRAPYCADSITDFWRRWHVSLSSWLRDYLYIPLGGNRRGFARKCVNTMIVFLVCGMWHGAGIHFLAWGLLHGLYSVVEAVWRRKGRQIKGGRPLTFLAVAFAWIFFRVDSLGEALRYVAGMLTAGVHPQMWGQYMELLGLSAVEFAVILTGILVILLADELCNKRKLHLPTLVQRRENAGRYLVFYMLIVAIFIFGMYGPGYHAEQFIYMQF